MIEIRITDPANEAPDTLRAVADLLTVFADAQGNIPARVAHYQRAAEGVKAAIAAVDSPAQGVDAAEVFAGGAAPEAVFVDGADPAQVFAQSPNVPAAPLQDASAAAVASAPVPSTNNAPIDLDSEGLPWDARIHSGGRTKVKAGTWTAKRGVDDAVIAQVKAELRAVLGNRAAPVVGAAVVTPAAPSIAPVNAGNVPPPPPPPSGAQAAPTVTPTAPATVPAVDTPVQTAPAQSVSFPQLCGKITNAIGTGALTQDALGAVLAANGLTGLPTLAAFPHLVQPVAVALGFA